MQETSEDAKALAEATFMKKRMFYNMKIKTMQRIASNVIKSVKGSGRIKIFKINKEIDFLTLRLKDTARELEETSHPAAAAEEDKRTAELENKRIFIQSKVYDKLEEIADIETVCESVKRKCYDVSEENIHKLMTELETGGNIRFEEGKAAEKWFKSCSDLLRSRFRPEHFEEYGIAGINITRITRIHNRFLRNQFEERLEHIIDIGDRSLKKSLDYLFVGMDPACTTGSQFAKIMEEGFKSGTIPLVNTLSLAELPRLSHMLSSDPAFSRFRAPGKSSQLKQAFQKGLARFAPGTVLICKVYISNPVPDASAPSFDPRVSSSQLLRDKPISGLTPAEEKCVFRTSDRDPAQRLWVFGDPAIILPEYLAEFEYSGAGAELGRSDAELNAEFDTLSAQLSAARQTIATNYRQMMGKPAGLIDYGTLSAVELDRSDLGCLKRTLVGIMKSCCVDELAKNGVQYTVSPAFAKEVDAVGPKTEERSSWGEISKDRLMEYCASKKVEPQTLVYLNLHNCGISAMENLSHMAGLRVLVLSFNQIKKIQGLEDNLALERLELGYNQIGKIENMETLARLRFFEINSNYVSNVQDLTHLNIYCPALEELVIRNNPFTSCRDYKGRVLAILPGVKKIDGFSILEKDKESVPLSQAEAAMTKELLAVSSKFSESAGPDTHDVEVSASPSLAKVTTKTAAVTLEPGWEQRVEEVNLSHMKLVRIDNLQDFSSLRRLILADNKISQISGLEACHLLEELNLEKNKITTIEGISHLSLLKKLDIGKNKIRSVGEIGALENLVQLSLEDNAIQSLADFPSMKNLMELYIGNNMICDFKEVKVLRQLGKLIILDISGNKVCQDPHYRLYIIFHLKKLKVLDGVSIEQTEFNNAKNAYAGRLTEEVLESRLSGKLARSVCELNLSAAKLRDFEDMFNEALFPLLEELNLTNNYFSSLRAFGPLPHLRVLILAQNKVESLYCKPDDKGDNLEVLDLSFNSLHDLYGLQLAPLRKLRQLNVSNNDLAKLEGLDGLKALRELDLSKNRVRQFDPSSFLPDLPIALLRAEENGLKSVACIERLERLEALYLGGNRINDFNDFDRLGDMKRLRELSLVNNPITRKNYYRQVVLRKFPGLAALDGKDVGREELERVEQMFVPDPAQGMTVTGGLPVSYQGTLPAAKFPIRMNPVNFDEVFGCLKGTAVPTPEPKIVPSAKEETKARRPVSTKFQTTVEAITKTEAAARIPAAPPGPAKLSAILDMLAPKPRKHQMKAPPLAHVKKGLLPKGSGHPTFK